jgi:membrane fusion protein (multidrug efflux system)
LDAKAPEQSEALPYQPAHVSRRQRIARRSRLAALVVIGIIGTAVLGTWIHDRFTHVYVDDARISADVISISSRVSGWVTQLRVGEGEAIRAGDALVTIDDRDSRLLLAELTARLASIDAERARLAAQKEMIDRQTSSQYTMRQSQVEAARAALAGRRSDLDLARTDFERARTLLERKVVSRQRWEEKRTVFRVAEQAWEQARAEVAAASAALIEAEANRQQLHVIDRQIAGLAHQKEELLARRGRQELDLRDRIIRSPLDGVVDRTFVKASEFVSAGQRLLMVHDPQRIWVDANVRETDIRHLRLGAPATVTVDAYPDLTFRGRITRIGNAATSEFALLPTPNPSGNFTKIAQRLTIRIELERNGERLSPGMMVEVTIGIDDR